MRKTLEDFYHGNLTPVEQEMRPNSELKRAVDRVTRFESQLVEQLDEAWQTVLAKLIESQSMTSQRWKISSWASGWGADGMDGNDGDIREVTDYG